MIIATAGHVDHGKTSIVSALTGIDTDRLEEEKSRGLTIDLGFAYSNMESGERLGFIDVPGHIRFINNMLAGVAAIDCALLVIAADDGVMPQTREHLDILNLMGIRHGIIALTKIDRCEPERITDATDEVRELVAGTFLADAEILPVSSVTGEGMETLQVALELAADEVQRRQHDGLFRLAIDRRFTIKGAGIVVTGSVFSGRASVGDEVFLMPQAIPVRIKSMHTQDQASQETGAGDRCAVNIAGNQLDLEDISRGNWLTTNPAPATDRIDVSLHILAGEQRPFSHWTPVHVHSAANHATGRAALLSPNKIEPGGDGLVQLVIEPPINVCFGDRVVIRDQAARRTIGGGIVINPNSPRRGRAREERVRLLSSLDPLDTGSSLQTLIEGSETGLEMNHLKARFNLDDDVLQTMIGETAIRLANDTWVIHPEPLARQATALLDRIDEWHDANPGKAGLPANQIRALARHLSDALFEHLLKGFIADKSLEQSGNLFNRPGRGVKLSPEEQKLWQRAEPMLQADPMKPPVLHDMAKSLNVPPKTLEKTLNQVIKTGTLVRPVKNRYFLSEALPGFIEAMHTAADDEGKFTASQYRDVTGVGRNLAIELLEYFDRQGVTRRMGDIRQIVEKS